MLSLLKLFLPKLVTHVIPMLIAAGVTAAAGAIYVNGYLDGKHKVELANLEKEKSYLEGVIRRQVVVIAKDAEDAAEDAEALAKAEAKIREITNGLKNPSLQCLDPDDVNRLLDLWDHRKDKR